MELILSRNQIKKIIKNFGKDLNKKFNNKTIIIISVLKSGTLPLSIDLLRSINSMLIEIDYLMESDNDFFLKSKTLNNKNVILCFDYLKNINNEYICKIIDYIKKYSPDSISIFSVIKEKEYSNIHNLKINSILISTDDNKKYCGYGINSIKKITDYLNIYTYD